MSEHSEVLLDRLDGRLSGEMDMATASAAETDFLAMALRTVSPTLTVDCTELTFIDSAGVHMLEHVAKRSGKPVQLTNVPQNCRRVFEVLNLCERFAIQPTGREREDVASGMGGTPAVG
jgi:anti-anti-sigma factor